MAACKMSDDPCSFAYPGGTTGMSYMRSQKSKRGLTYIL